MGPADLAQVLRHLPPSTPNPNLLVGLDTGDDAGVIRIDETTALVQSLDFFMPIVDDPYDYGRIAAANSLSDIYAMGAKPLTALNIVGFPVGSLDMAILADILRGGHDAVEEAGALLIGGHSIDDQEPKYGLSVTGIVHPDEIWTNAGARPGDVLVLSKPIGIGAITTGIKRDKVGSETAAEAVAVMASLNDSAAAAGRRVTVNACTDVTGFGLLGHASEIARASKVGLIIEYGRVPAIDGALDLINEGILPGGTRSNLRAFEGETVFSPDLGDAEKLLVADAVTSGGLLFSVPASYGEALAEYLKEEGAPAAAIIGRVTDEHPGVIHVVP